MRIIRFLIYYAMVTALGLIALLFLALNHFTVRLELIAAQYSVSVAWVIVGAAAFGFVMALLVLLPGRIATGLYARGLARDVRALNDDVRDLEYALDEQEDLRARLLEQHEILLERHEDIVMRHQELVSDHHQVVAERNDVRAQLAALRIPRPARPTGASHGSAVATALRLVPPTQAASGVPAAPVARPTTPQPAPAPVPAPVARIAPPAAPVAPAAATPGVAAPAEPAPAPTVERPVTPITPGPWPGVAAVTPAAPEPDPEPATVPVVSAPPAPAAPSTPTRTVSEQPPVAVAAAPAEPRVKGPSVWTRLQVGARQSWQSAAARFSDTRQRLQRRGGKAWRSLTTTVIAQRKAQLARLQAFQQRLTPTRNEAE